MSDAWLPVVVPALASALIIALVRSSDWSRHLADVPNERSLHSRPTPRVGGIGLTLAALPFVAAAGSPTLAAIAACAAFLALISLADDIRSLPIEVRLPAHFAAAVIALLAIGSWPATSLALPWIEAIAFTLAIVWMANLFNFMDGSDGLAGGMVAIGFAALGSAACIADAKALALASTAIASAALGFLAHNLPPARVFLGDCGSIPLGFLAAVLGLLGSAHGVWPLWFPLLVFSPFIVDASLTLLMRLGRRERFWTAHRSHHYQRLVLAGWSRRRLAWSAYALMLASAASALLGLRGSHKLQCAIILGWFAIYSLLFVAIARRTKATSQADQLSE